MTELDDHELLAEYARTGAEAPFAGLVARYVPLVYSAAHRFTGNSHHAEEITQAVFVILARKAGRLSRRVVLSGWLYQTARLTAANFVKGEIRRQSREQEAYMQSTVNEPDAETWRQIAPLLEEAMGSLGETDRTALVLRFFENKSASEVAATLKLREAAAHKRLRRAVEKLRKFFMKRGIILSSLAITVAVSTNSVQAAPLGLGGRISAMAAPGTLISAALTTLVKGTMNTMNRLKLKFAAGVAGAVLLAGGAAGVAVSQISGVTHPTASQIVRQAMDTYAALSCYSDNETEVSEGTAHPTTTKFNIRLQRPKQYRIDWSSTGGYYDATGVAWSDGHGDFFAAGAADQDHETVKAHDMEFAFGAVGGYVAEVPGIFFKSWGDILFIPASGKEMWAREKDESAAGVDYYVIESIDLEEQAELPNQSKRPENKGTPVTFTHTLWIGKQDHLIHKSRCSVEGIHVDMAPLVTDKALSTILERGNKAITPEAIAALRNEMVAGAKQGENSKMTSTETHENISVNEPFSAKDFAP